MHKPSDDGSTRQQLAEVLIEPNRLRRENAQLRHKLATLEAPGGSTTALSDLPVAETSATATMSSQEKVALFRDLFRGRADVFPVRWENKAGKSGYSPACGNEWRPGVCEKPRIKCSDCPNQQFLPVTDKVLFDHLADTQTVGVYPILKGDLCYFLAADFDDADWRADTLAFRHSCEEHSVPAHIEISRSGNGAHVWIFFGSPISAVLARQLGTALITHASAQARQLKLSSYDRLFPSQDSLPKGGFGNLIALPLQKKPRETGCSVFVDRNLQPYADQWNPARINEGIGSNRMVPDKFGRISVVDSVAHLAKTSVERLQKLD